MIDTSSSMLGDGLDVAKTAAKSVISTLSNNDFVGVISFDNIAKTLVANRITRATLEHQWKLEEEIDYL